MNRWIINFRWFPARVDVRRCDQRWKCPYYARFSRYPRSITSDKTKRKQRNGWAGSEWMTSRSSSAVQSTLFDRYHRAMNHAIRTNKKLHVCYRVFLFLQTTLIIFFYLNKTTSIHYCVIIKFWSHWNW